MVGASSVSASHEAFSDAVPVSQSFTKELNTAAATFEDMFATLRKGEAAVVPEVAFEPANIPDVTAAPANDEVFF